MDPANPNAGQLGQCGQVLVHRQPLRLEAPHLAGHPAAVEGPQLEDKRMDTPIANDARQRAVEEIFSAAETRSCPSADTSRAPGNGGRPQRFTGVREPLNFGMPNARKPHRP